MLHVLYCCFSYQTSCFFDVLVVVSVDVAKAPYELLQSYAGNWVKIPPQIVP